MNPGNPNLATTPAITLDKHATAAGLSCVHCGLCLPACPTYTQNGNEADSPRGRIQLMLGLSTGTIPASDSVRRHLDLCLDCRACETACPSGVSYHQLIEPTRAQLASSAPRSINHRLMRWMFFHIFTHPARMKLALLPARFFRAIGLFKILPRSLRTMGEMLPANLPAWSRPLPEKTPATSAAKMNVEFFPGCIGSVIYDRVNRQAIELLAHSSADVTVSPKQNCCGAVHLHNGDAETARKLARENIDALLGSASAPDRITTTIAGCGAMLREYAELLRDDPAYREKAAAFSARVRDITETLVELPMPEMKHAINQRTTYHDACHLAHAQRVTAAPRMLLAKIPGLTMVALPESDMCCGAAGTYNLSEPEMASQLAARKLAHIGETDCKTCVAGNVGCSMHLRAQAELRGIDLELLHPVELLHRSAFGG
jgi:glycolate oxidase iron-sulfur subunit